MYGSMVTEVIDASKDRRRCSVVGCCCSVGACLVGGKGLEGGCLEGGGG